MSRVRFDCLDCHRDVSKLGDYCMLKDKVWFSIHDSREGMLCIGCIEKRLGRKLNSSDFVECLLNSVPRPYITSQLFVDRLRSKPPVSANGKN